MIEWDTLPEETPDAIHVILQRCLEKDPRRRVRDIGEDRRSARLLLKCSKLCGILLTHLELLLHSASTSQADIPRRCATPLREILSGHLQPVRDLGRAIDGRIG